jgi:hypothetical protein
MSHLGCTWAGSFMFLFLRDSSFSKTHSVIPALKINTKIKTSQFKVSGELRASFKSSAVLT